jgi:hypothetical protein
VRRAFLAGVLIVGVLAVVAVTRGAPARATGTAPARAAGTAPARAAATAPARATAPRFVPALPAHLPQFALPQPAVAAPRAIVPHANVPRTGGGVCFVASGACSLNPCVQFAQSSTETAMNIVGFTATGSTRAVPRSRCIPHVPTTVSIVTAPAATTHAVMGRVDGFAAAARRLSRTFLSNR